MADNLPTTKLHKTTIGQRMYTWFSLSRGKYMIRKTITFLFVVLMVSSIFMTPQSTNISTLEITPEKNNLVAETDLSRVTLEADIAPNGDFETWSVPYYPTYVYTTRTTEESTWIETVIVNEGSKAVGMQARSLDGYFESEVRLTQQSWVYWSNPVNATIDLDWYLDEIGTPLNSDYFRMQVRMSGRNIYYYLGCDTTSTNVSYAGFINVDGPIKAWNHLHRNLTSDYFDVFGLYPTQFELIYWWVYSETTEYTRAYMDDVNLVNGTYVHVGGSTLNGNFEGSGGWTYQSDTDPADISQSSTSHGGNWSMNMTSISYDYSARATAQIYFGKRLSPDNQGLFSFFWRIDDWVNPTTNTIAEVRVAVSNTTTSLTMHYYLCVGGAGTLPIILFGDDMKFQVIDFNLTDTWNYFDRNIWEDFHTYSNSHDLYLDSISFYVTTNDPDSRLSVLFDDMTFTSVLVTDTDYETQGAIGTPIEGWTEPVGYDTFTVTDFAANGIKAGNLTLEDSQDFYADQSFGKLKFDSTTEIIFDFNLYLDQFNETSDDDFLLFEFTFGDGEELTYIIANASSTFEEWISETSNVIFLEAVTEDQWLNYQMDLVHDYEAIIGSLPDTTLDDFFMISVSSTSSKLVAYIDDLYLYFDPAPEISNVGQTPLNPEVGGFTLVSATVVDATIDSVVLNYRVDTGSWMTLDMEQTVGDSFIANMTSLSEGTYEYYITATDAFGKATDALNDTDYFSFNVGEGPTTPPGGLPILPIVAVIVIAAVGVVIILYMFVLKKKE